MPRVTFPNWQFQNNTSCKLFWIHWNKKHNQCKVTPVPSPHAQSSCVYHRFPDGAMGGQAALAQDTTSLPDCNPNTSSLLDRALTSPHCHLRVKDYGDRKGITAFPKKKKSLLTCCRALSFFLWQTVLSLLRSHKNNGKIPGMFCCFHLETCPKVISQCKNKRTHRTFITERCCLRSHSTPEQVQLKYMTIFRQQCQSCLFNSLFNLNLLQESEWTRLAQHLWHSPTY